MKVAQMWAVRDGGFRPGFLEILTVIEVEVTEVKAL
jgi:hypothetical protein